MYITSRDSLYLACVLYNKDRVIVTEEDRYLPLLEVENSYGTNATITTAFNWLMKVNCHWSEINKLKHDMEKLNNVTSYSMKLQLLTALQQLQVFTHPRDYEKYIVMNCEVSTSNTPLIDMLQ